MIFSGNIQQQRPCHEKSASEANQKPRCARPCEIYHASTRDLSLGVHALVRERS
jgi:hypothetical protein